ncbi:MAG: VCBS repeat-containing protein [Ignavibacteriaceae bacterium]|nr:VCBS repeat-containing protein [Ignavibacteriaceae bacterium]
MLKKHSFLFALLFVTISFTECFSQLRITQVIPSSGVAGSVIQIHGTGFSEASTVKFGNINSPQVQFINSNLILVQVPDGLQPGKKNLSVLNEPITSNGFDFIPILPTPGTLVFLEQSPSRIPLVNKNSRIPIAGDIDSDSDIDLIVIALDTSEVWINNGNGLFQNQTASRLPNAIYSSRDGKLADIDNDNDLDLLITNAWDGTKSNQLFLNNGSGYFIETIDRIPEVNFLCRGLDFGDADLDGDLDIIIAVVDNSAVLFINDGNGYFTDESILRGVSSFENYASGFGDIDNDGDQDIVFAGVNSNTLLLNDGLGYYSDITSANLPSRCSTPSDLEIFDFNGDHYLDIFFPKYSGNCNDQILINDGTGNFIDESLSRLPSNGSWKESAVGDFDGDNDLDIRTRDAAPSPYQSAIYINDGAGYFISKSTELGLFDVGSCVGFAISDFNNDGYLDHLSVDRGVNWPQIFIGSNTGYDNPPVWTFRPAIQFCKPGDIISTQVKATDADGEKLTYKILNFLDKNVDAPSGSILNPNSGKFFWKTDLNDVGIYNTHLYAEDRKKATNSCLLQMVVDKGVHEKNNVKLLLNEDGFFSYKNGLGGLNSYPKGEADNYIFAAGLWVGGIVNNQKIVSHVFYNSEFAPSLVGNTGDRFHVFNSSINEDAQSWPPEFSHSDGSPLIVQSAQNLVVEYNDYDGFPRDDVQIPLGIEVRQRSLEYNDAKKKNAVIMIWEIINISSEVIEDAYTGFFIDVDIGDAYEDRGSIVNDIGIIWDNDFSEMNFSLKPSIVGFAFLETFSNSPINFSTTLPWQDPRTDSGKYNIMAGINIYESLDQGDYRIYISTPIDNLLPGDSRVIAGALLFGASAASGNSITVDPVTFRPNPNDPMLADIQSTRIKVQQFYDQKLKGMTLPKKNEIVQNNLPEKFELYQNYPNPFNPTTSIQYAISSRQFVSLKVYDILGNEIDILANEEKPAGTYELNWNARQFPAGVYFYQLKAGSFVQTKKMILLR